MPRRAWSRLFYTAFVALWLPSTAALADEPRRVAVGVDSGWVVNQGELRGSVFSDVIQIDRAGWLRIDFEEAVLGRPRAAASRPSSASRP